MYLRRDTLAALLNSNAELTLAQALEELRVPLGSIDATINPEDWFVIGQRLCHRGDFVAAGGVGTRSQVGLRCSNTATIPGLVVLEQYLVGNPNAGAITAVLRANFLEVNSNQGFVRDARFGTLAGSRSIHGQGVSQNVAAASGTVIGNLYRLAAGETSPVTPHVSIIGPGQNLVLDPAADNLAIEAFWWWREFDLRQR